MLRVESNILGILMKLRYVKRRMNRKKKVCIHHYTVNDRYITKCTFIATIDTTRLDWYIKNDDCKTERGSARLSHRGNKLDSV